MELVDDLNLNGTKFGSKMCSFASKKGLVRCHSFLVEKQQLLFGWNLNDGTLNVMSIEKKQLLDNHLILLPLIFPLYIVDTIAISANMKYAAIAGSRGLSLMKLPRNLSTINCIDCEREVFCKVLIVDQPYFLFNKTELLQIKWDPKDDADLFALFSDNSIRLFKDSYLRSIYRVGAIPSVLCVGPITDIAAAFDFIPTSLLPKYLPINAPTLLCSDSPDEDEYLGKPKPTILKHHIITICKNGKILILASGTSGQSKLVLNQFSNIDGFGVSEFKSIIVFPSNPPTIVIADQSSIFYHGLIVQNNLNDCNTNKNSTIEMLCEWAFHFIESIILEDKKEQSESSIIYLERNYINNYRYFAYNSLGLYDVKLGFLADDKFHMERNILQNISELKNKNPTLVSSIFSANVSKKKNISNEILGFCYLHELSSVIMLYASRCMQSRILDPKSDKMGT